MRAWVVASVSSGALIAGLGFAFVADQVVADGTAGGPPAPVTVNVSAAINDIALQQGKQGAPSGDAQAVTPAGAQSAAGAAPAAVAIATPATTPTVASPDPAELECLTAAVYYEARGEAPAGQAAVAQVVLNRVGQAHFAKTVCGVVYQGVHTRACQFSFACHGRPHGAREDVAWTRSRAVASRALSGYVMRQIGHATYFHVASLGQVWGPRMAPVAHVGHHIFYAASTKQELRHAYRVLQADAKAAPQGSGQQNQPSGEKPLTPVSSSASAAAPSPKAS